MNTSGWIGALLDKAGAPLLQLEEDGIFPSKLRLSSEVYDSLVRLRYRELEHGNPLVLLGTQVVEDASLSRDDFALEP
ncbi:hypothetical protein [Pseudonocardia xishanensis]|uniref:Uncharacterized protein n=1 Tax=Pseudonocardia xishanensis TaxID=630995 RepID=A0ABP8REG4_9PSEU